MKNKLWLGMLVIILVFGMTIVGCVSVTAPSRSVITSPTGIQMVWIPAGTFIMGSPENEPDRYDNEAQHQVTLTSGFYMGVYQVTQEQYQAVMDTNPSRFRGDNHPVEQVSWYDAIEFCNRLSVMEGLTPAYRLNDVTNPSLWGPKGERWNNIQVVEGSTGYRLPTESQWEYACRGSYPNKARETATKPFGIGDGTKITWEIANFDGRYPYDVSQGGGYEDSTGIYQEKTTAVGSYGVANNYGLYDMHGNVWEWCWDWYDDYTSDAKTDPAGAVTGDNRVLRGGSWYGLGRNLRSAFRGNFYPSIRDDNFGFRLVRP